MESQRVYIGGTVMKNGCMLVMALGKEWLGGEIDAFEFACGMISCLRADTALSVYGAKD